MNIIVFACHPDDETLGCGGAVLRHKSEGDKVYWVIATCMKEADGFRKKLVMQRDKEINAVQKAFGFDKVYSLGISTTKVDQCKNNELVEMVSEIFNEVRPDIIYLPFRADVHSDHRILFEAVYSCTKIFRYPFIRKILMMEAVSETEFAPSLKEDAFLANYYVDISDFLEKKIRIAKLYKGEMGKHPFPRSAETVRALATLRGSQAGCKYAEGFALLKEIC